MLNYMVQDSRNLASTARRVVETAIGEHLDGSPLKIKASNKDANAVARGRLGGLKGGYARAKKSTPKQRKTIALKAVKARWKK
jgi:hypothetical protein